MNNIIEEKELTNFFKKDFLSISSSKIIRDSSGKSKGFGFVYLSDFNEYTKLLNLNEPIIFHEQALIIK